MIFHRDNEYHDPEMPGSLVGALRTWQMLCADDVQGDQQRLTFAFSCPSASVAHTVSWFLHRRPVCEATTVSALGGGGGAEWRVGGTTRQQLQSLETLERLYTWLRIVGQRHRAPLIHLSV